MSDQINLPQNWTDFWSMRLRQSDGLTGLITYHRNWPRLEDLFLAIDLLVQAIHDFNEHYGLKYEKSDWLTTAPNLYRMHHWSPDPNGEDTSTKTVSCATLLEELTALENTYQFKRGLNDLFENSRRIIECYARIR